MHLIFLPCRPADSFFVVVFCAAFAQAFGLCGIDFRAGHFLPDAFWGSCLAVSLSVQVILRAGFASRFLQLRQAHLLRFPAEFQARGLVAQLGLPCRFQAEGPAASSLRGPWGQVSGIEGLTAQPLSFSQASRLRPVVGQTHSLLTVFSEPAFRQRDSVLMLVAFSVFFLRRASELWPSFRRVVWPATADFCGEFLTSRSICAQPALRKRAS